MKLQLDAQHLRLRLSEAEFAALLQGAPVRSSTRLPGAAWSLAALGCDDAEASLAPARAPAAAAADRHSSDGDAVPAGDGVVDALLLRLPLPLLEAYRQRLPCRDGIELQLRVDDGTPLRVSVEVDVRDSVRTRGAKRKV